MIMVWHVDHGEAARVQWVKDVDGLCNAQPSLEKSHGEESSNIWTHLDHSRTAENYTDYVPCNCCKQ